MLSLFCREVVRGRCQKPSFDPDLLNQKLNRIIQSDNSSFIRPTPRSYSLTPTDSRSPTDSEYAFCMRENFPEQEYWDLIEVGGRPAWPLEFTYFRKNQRGKYKDIIESWGNSFHTQKIAWMKFRRFQRAKRRSQEKFAEYKQDIIGVQQKEGFDDNINLLFDYTQQDKINEWKEYYCYRLRSIPHLKIAADKAHKKRMHDKEEAEKGRGDPDFPFFLFEARYSDEAKYDTLVYKLNWMLNEQLPEIIKEYESSTRELSHLEFEPNEGQAAAKTESERPGLNTQDGSRKKPLGTNKLTRSISKKLEEPLPSTAPLRRSQRLINLAAKRKRDSDSTQEQSSNHVVESKNKAKKGNRHSKKRKLDVHDAKPKNASKPSGISRKQKFSRKTPRAAK